MRQKSRKKINQKMTIREVLEVCPKAEEILNKHLGLCTDCPAAQIETLALGCHLHNKDVKKIIKELNKICNKRGKNAKSR